MAVAAGPTVVVVGAGQAGSQTAASLREQGFTGRVVLVGDEPHPPYQRPPLSKGHLTGKAARDALWLRSPDFYTDKGIELRLGVHVTSIDCAGRVVRLESGESLPYDRLVLATGARNRELAVHGASLAGVVMLRTLSEADEVKERLAKAQHVVVIGGGFIGMEVAATAAGLGRTATVLELADQLMGRVLSAETAAFLLQAHRSRGLSIELGASAAEVLGEDGRVTGVRTTDGRTLPADLVLVGIGAVPNTELAADAGLAVANGIVVDQHLRTEDPAVYAVGDCAAFPCAYAGGSVVRLESVQNAMAQPRALAASLTGAATPFESVPWFWSDQADLKLQIAGLTTGHHRAVVRGDLEAERFSVFCFDDTAALLGVESINLPADHMVARKLLAARLPLTPEQAGDEGFDLKAAVKRAVNA